MPVRWITLFAALLASACLEGDPAQPPSELPPGQLLWTANNWFAPTSPRFVAPGSIVGVTDDGVSLLYASFDVETRRYTSEVWGDVDPDCRPGETMAHADGSFYVQYSCSPRFSRFTEGELEWVSDIGGELLYLGYGMDLIPVNSGVVFVGTGELDFGTGAQDGLHVVRFDQHGSVVWKLAFPAHSGQSCGKNLPRAVRGPDDSTYVKIEITNPQCFSALGVTEPGFYVLGVGPWGEVSLIRRIDGEPLYSSLHGGELLLLFRRQTPSGYVLDAITPNGELAWQLLAPPMAGFRVMNEPGRGEPVLIDLWQTQVGELAGVAVAPGRYLVAVDYETGAVTSYARFQLDDTYAFMFDRDDDYGFFVAGNGAQYPTLGAVRLP